MFSQPNVCSIMGENMDARDVFAEILYELQSSLTGFYYYHMQHHYYHHKLIKDGDVDLHRIITTNRSVLEFAIKPDDTIDRYEKEGEWVEYVVSRDNNELYRIKYFF